jgi:hypothetical protein
MYHNQRWSCRSAARLHPAEILCLAFCFFICCSFSLRAQQVVLFTGHLNNDCVADTIKGRSAGLHEYVPETIVWGKPVPNQDCPDAVQGGHAPGTFFVPMTKFLFPGWNELHVSVSLLKYNRNDNLDDLLLYVWGQYRDAQGQWRDTARALVVFGQNDLDLQPALSVQHITAGFQSSPFFAMDVRVGRELVEPQERDVTGGISYELLPADVQIVPDKPAPPHPIATPDSVVTTVSVSPNPADLFAKLQAEPLEPGEYDISILAVNGSVYHTQTVQIGQGKSLEHELDLSSLPSGYYVVRLHTSNHYIGSYSIVIVK